MMIRLISALMKGLVALDCQFSDLDLIDWRCVVRLTKFGDVVKVMKQFTAWPLAYLQDTHECPAEVEGWSYRNILGNKFHRWVKRHVLSESVPLQDRLLKAEVFLRLKRSALKVSDDFIDEALQNHGVDIGVPDRDHTPEEEEEFEHVLEWVDMVVDRVMSVWDDGKFVPANPMIRDAEPTNGACTARNKEKGGAFRELIDFSIKNPLSSCLHSMCYHPRFGVHETRFHPEWMFPTFKDHIDRTLEEERRENREPVPCVAIGLPEPFKVRVITKGDAGKYHLARLVQKVLTTKLQTCSISRFFPALQGRVDEEVLTKIFGHTDGIFLSGDYKGATDTLRADLSEYVLCRLLNHLPEIRSHPWMVKELVDCLCNHVIHYRSVDHKNPSFPKFSVRQRRGQLMGSFLSFPVLNIANLAINLRWLEKNGIITRKDWRKAPVCVNGDDVLMRVPKDEDQDIFCSAYDYDKSWTDYVKTFAGFTKSLGKNYFSHKFCTINSTLFNLESGRFMEVRCPRTEFLYYSAESLDLNDPQKWKVLKRFETVEDWVGPQNCGKLLKEFLDTVPRHNRVPFIEYFVREHQEAMVKTRRPWYLPGDIGGLGIPCYPEQMELWREDGILASHILRLANTGRYFGYGNEIKLAKDYSKSRLCDIRQAQEERYYQEIKGVRRVMYVFPHNVDLPVSTLPSLNIPSSNYVFGEEDLLPDLSAMRRSYNHDTKQMSRMISQAKRSNLEPLDLSTVTISVGSRRLTGGASVLYPEMLMSLDDCIMNHEQAHPEELIEGVRSVWMD
jgi:hypothetical protein